MLPIVLAAAVLLGASLNARAEDDKPDPGPAPSADELRAVDELVKHGARADQLAAGINWRYVNFRGVEKPDAALYAQLKAIPSIVELSLAGKELSTDDLANISGLKSLAILNLSKTNVTDDALAAVEKLEKLNSLNLFATGITDAGLAHLSGLKNLHRLYLAETKVTDAGVETLKKSLPEVKVNRGPELAPVPPPAPAAPPAPKPDEAKLATPPGKTEEKKPEAPPAPKADEPKPPAAPPKPEEKKPDAPAAPAK